MTPTVRPENYNEFRSRILQGEAVPSVYHSLVEAAIRDGIAPIRIMTAWGMRHSLWEAISLIGAVLVLLNLWWVGLCVMVLAVVGSLKHSKPMQVRLGYCAVVGYALGTWAFDRGYLSLIAIPEALRERWSQRNVELLELAEEDLHRLPEFRAFMFNGVTTWLLPLLKIAVGTLLVLSAWRAPGWLTIGIGGVIGAFFVLQSLVRLRVLLSSLSPRPDH